MPFISYNNMYIIKVFIYFTKLSFLINLVMQAGIENICFHEG